MRAILRTILVAVMLVSGASGAQSGQQAPVAPMTPSEPHERLTFFEGAWTYDEARPASKFSEVCAWLPSGRRHMVCHSTSQSATGQREGYSIFSHRQADDTYVYQGFRPNGDVESLVGRVSEDGRTWEFWGEEGSGAHRTKIRVRITPLAEGGFRFSQQTAVGFGEWSPEFVVHYRKVQAR